MTFREWSILVSMGETGMKLLHDCREARRAAMALQSELHRDAMVHGTAIYRTTISMGEGCTPLRRRVDPADFFLTPPPPEA